MRKGLLYTACWIFLLISCAEDLGNYDYRELSSPVVTGIDEKIPVRKFERLQLTPQIEGEQFTEEDYQFEWKVIPQADAVTATVMEMNAFWIMKWYWRKGHTRYISR